MATSSSEGTRDDLRERVSGDAVDETSGSRTSEISDTMDIMEEVERLSGLVFPPAEGKSVDAFATCSCAVSSVSVETIDIIEDVLRVRGFAGLAQGTPPLLGHSLDVDEPFGFDNFLVVRPRCVAFEDGSASGCGSGGNWLWDVVRERAMRTALVEPRDALEGVRRSLFDELELAHATARAVPLLADFPKSKDFDEGLIVAVEDTDELEFTLCRTRAPRAVATKEGRCRMSESSLTSTSP